MTDIERFTPSMGGRIAYEHLHRYAFVKDFAAGADVLDVACGEGYGAHVLASVARHVVALDGNAACIDAAQTRYGSERLEFLCGDAAAIPAPDASFDVVVSFETIEHLLDPEGFIGDIRRVLRPGGLLVISSPNEPEYRKSLASPNPFHLKEFDLQTFDDILARQFAYREMLGQRMFIASSLAPLGRHRQPNDPAYRGLTGTPGDGERLADLYPGVARLASPEYLLCLCSDAPIEHPVAADSVFLMPDDDLWLEHRQVMRWASGVDGEMTALQQRLGQVENERAAALREGAVHQQQAQMAGEIRALLDAERASTRRVLEASHALVGQHEKMNQVLLQREQETRARLVEAEQRAADIEAVQRAGLERELSVLTPLLSRLKGEAVTATIPVLADVLAVGWHERSVMEGKLGGLSARLSDEAARYDQLAAEMASLTASKARMAEQIDSLTAELAEAQTSHSSKEDALKQSVQSLRAEQTDEAARYDQLAAEMASLTASKARMAEQIDSLTAELAEARTSHSSKEDALKQSVQSLRAQAAERDAAASKLAAIIDMQSSVAKGETLVTTNELAEMVDLIAYRDQLRRDMLTSARVLRRLQAAAPPMTAQAVLPVEPGDELCERLYFDESYYIAHVPELLDGDIDAFRHYLEKGWREGLSPCALFDGDWYLAKYPQALEAGINPLSHYVRYGLAAGFQPHPCFDRVYYSERYPDALRHTPDPFLHFMRQGLQLNNAPSANIAALASGSRMINVLSLILEEDLTRLKEPADPRAWPAPLNDYWLPQTLNDYINDEFGPASIKELSYLFSLISAFESDPAAFEESPDLKYLVRRCRMGRDRSKKVRPDVSIIIPVHNNLIYTLTAIVSILEHKTSLALEIIVGDDCSTDATPRIVGALGPSVTLTRHATNLGFLQNCNACARQAEGRYLVFLNNDTLVLPGWLDELIAPLQSGKNIGMTGSKLINGDGTLQEAGGIMWEDGSAWNYGRGSDPRLPHFSYSKDVDYCSGASIALSKTLWDELGGFDTLFSPAYCEDSDLAFRVRAAGSRMWLAASSVLIHHEGRSHGRDVNSGVKTYQVTNHAKLVDRWQETFARELHPNAQNVFLARDRSARKPHILIVDHYIPQWDRDAGSRTMLHFTRMFVQQGFQVTFWPDNLYHDRAYAKPMQDMGVEIIYGPQYVDGFENWIRASEDFIPYVFLSRPQIAEKYIDIIDRSKTKILYYGHDLHWKRLEKQLAVNPTDDLRLEMEAMRRLEEQICLKSDVALYPSGDEIEVLSKRLPGLPAAAVPAWYFDSPEIEAMHTRVRSSVKRESEHLMFVGGFQHQPNVDGVIWFVSEVWPIVRAACPDVRLTLAGSNPPESIRSLMNLGQSITVAGHISDLALDQLYKHATLAIVPLRFGGGVKGKLIEAFSKGIPVVSTPTGVQGITEADKICFIADDAEKFAKHVINCISNPASTNDKAHNAVKFLEQNYAINSLVESLSPFIKEFDNG